MAIGNKKSKNDHILIFVSILLLLLVSGAVILLSSRGLNLMRLADTRVQVPKTIGTVTLTIDVGTGKNRSFKGDIIEGENLLDALKQASVAGSFYYKLDGKSNLAAIEKFSKNNQKSWHCYLNGKKISMPLNEINLKSGDKILIKYEEI